MRLSLFKCLNVFHRMYTWIKSNEQPVATAPPKRDIELGTTGARTDSTDRQVLWQVNNDAEKTSEKP